MPRRSNHTSSDESPVTRRTSARIAAAQAASPAKSPAKSPRRKRQSHEPAKVVSDDTESQQSQVKSEVSMEDLNGTETGSSTKDRESITDSFEIPTKKTKVDDSDDAVLDAEKCNESEVVSEDVSEPVIDNQDKTDSHDFEVVEQSAVPPPDSAEVQAAISAQGEDGQLLVGFVQVDKEEIPAANSIEIKQVTAVTESEQEVVRPPEENDAVEAEEESPVAPVNGDIVPEVLVEDEEPKTNGSAESDVVSKVLTHDEVQVHPPVSPAAGDVTPDVIAPELIPQ